MSTLTLATTTGSSVVTVHPDVPLLIQLVDDSHTLLYDCQRLKETDTYTSLGLDSDAILDVMQPCSYEELHPALRQELESGIYLPTLRKGECYR